MDRVNELVHEIVAERLTRLADPRLEPVTITGAEVTSDLGYATIYYATFGADEAAVNSAAEAGLASAAPVLRAAIGKEARLRQTPELRFRFDPGIEQGRRIDDILRGLDHPAEEPE
jgi:ribosome-binding factor A